MLNAYPLNSRRSQGFLSAVSSSIQHYLANGMSKKKKQRLPVWKGKSKIVFIHPWNDHLHRKLDGIYRKATRTNEWFFLQDYRI